MTVSLFKADQYHLNVRAEFPAHVKRAQLKVHFFLPSQLAENSDIANPSSFYQNLSQKQVIRFDETASVDSVQRALFTLKHTAYAQARTNQRRYRLALSHFVTDIRQLLNGADEPLLLQLNDAIEQCCAIHDNEQHLGQARLYKLARHQLTYDLHQSLLALLRQQNSTDTPRLSRLLERNIALAKQHKFKLHDDSEEGQERLLNKLHLGRKVINTPYKVKRKKLKNGQYAEQLIFGVAAALAMAFATAVAFFTQQAFGNFSTPFFFSLVISYILKDRIKELGRQYLMQVFSSRYFQHQSRYYQGSRQVEIAATTESFFSQSQQHLPKQIQSILNRRPGQETSQDSRHWIYQRRYNFNTEKQRKSKEKFIDELTINLSKTLRSLPKILSNHHYQQGQNIRLATVHKVHTIHLLISVDLGDGLTYSQHRIVTSRKGVHGIYKIEINNL